MAVKVTLTVPAGPSGDATFVGNAVEGIVWAADSGAEVLNMSFGTPTYHQALADAVAYAAGRDVLAVAAAGNTQDDPGREPGPRCTRRRSRGCAVGATPARAARPPPTPRTGPTSTSRRPGPGSLSTWDTRAPGSPSTASPLLATSC